MQTVTEGYLVIVALESGEEILHSLREVTAAHDIRGGSVTGIGSVSEIELAFFDPEKKEYVPRTFTEPMEIGSLLGNISRVDGEPHVHLHVTVCGPELIAFTGHLNRGIVGTACEIHIRRLKRTIERIKDPESGFDPLKLR